MSEVASSIRTLAWCIFWGLLAHGCWTGGVMSQPAAQEGEE